MALPWFAKLRKSPVQPPSAKRIRPSVALALEMLEQRVVPQATRTWVSGVGDDVNPCSRTAPCKTFAGAISKTAVGGEIDALDPGGFGAVTITKAITIDGGPNAGGILASGVNGIIINDAVTSGDSRNIFIRNVNINGAGTTLGTNGINILSAGQVVVQHCTIERFSQSAINIATSANVSVSILDSTLAFSTNGLFSHPSAGTAFVTVDNVRALGNSGFGFGADARTLLQVSNSVASSSTGFNYLASNGGFMMLAHDESLGANVGVQANNTATVFLSDVSFVTGVGGTAIVPNGGTITSFKNNVDVGQGGAGNLSGTTNLL